MEPEIQITKQDMEQITPEERKELGVLRKDKLKKRIQSALGYLNTNNLGSCLENLEEAARLCKILK